jgi:hypothetical protein
VHSVLSAVLGASLMLALAACEPAQDEANDVIASVHREIFTRADLQERMPLNYTQEDSARLANQLRSAWIRERALLHVAENNLSEVQKDVQKQLEDYRKSLIIYAYEEAFMRQKLDTLVSDAELRAYFEANADNFRLKRDIVKVKFVKLAEDAPRQAEVERWLKSDSEEDADFLYDYCRKYAENFFFDSEVWLFADDVAKEVPLPVADIEKFLKSGSFHKMDQDGFRYFVRVYEFRLRGDYSPFSLERGRMRDLILNKRKAELISKMREDVVKEGLAAGWIKSNEQ